MIKTSIICDKCGVGYEIDGTMTMHGITIFYRSKGWTIGKKHLCPDCKVKKTSPNTSNDVANDTIDKQ